MSRRGFTLLELMLAMTALALVAAICYGAFHLGVRAVEHGEVAVVSAQRMRVATDVIIRQIKSTVPYAARNRDEEVYPYFFGSATSMAFITAAGLDGGGGLARVVYQVVDDPPRLVVGESPFMSPDRLGRDPVDKPGERAAVLLDGFRSLRFEYLFNDGVDSDWRPEWNGHDEEALPAAVRILVEGIPGLEVDRWGQEIPIMAALYGENGNELGEDEEARLEGDGDPDDNGGDPGGDGQ
jgi:prepilin-type N-terminal cleavage/methylation domain-containing protein